jgi:hypothetical protein
MKYYVTLMSTAGVIEEHALDLDIDDTIKWHDFVNLLPVQQLLRERPTLEVLDITPEDMLLIAQEIEPDDENE